MRGQGEGEGEGGGGCEGTREMTHLCMSTRVYRKPWWWRKMGVLFQRHCFVEMVLREGRREGGRERGRERGKEGGRRKGGGRGEDERKLTQEETLVHVVVLRDQKEGEDGETNLTDILVHLLV